MKYAATFDAREWQLIPDALDILEPDNIAAWAELDALKARLATIERHQAPAR